MPPRLLVPRSLHTTYRHTSQTIRIMAFSTTSPKMTRPSVPPNAWDSHMHVTDPKNFPPAASATYAPHAALLPAALENASRLNLPNLVLVQPSTYGTDNSCLLDALTRLGPSRARGVVVFDPATTSQSTLRKWHDLGVRGVRVNLKSVGKAMETEELLKMLRSYLDAIRPLKTWVLQLYVDMAAAAQLEPLVRELNGVKLVVDHFSTPALLTKGMKGVAGWEAVLRMMKDESVFAKISAPYRVSRDPEYKDLEEIAKEFFKVRGGDGIVFASDWPHTRFESTDILPWVDRCLEWCGDDKELREKLFRDNAKVLWDVE